jgi:hypothetical protein
MVLGTDHPGVTYSEVREFDDQFGEHSEVYGFDDRFGEHSEVCGFGDHFGEHSEVCGFDDQFGKHSEVCGFTNQFSEHLPSVSLVHMSVFPPAQECLTREMLLDPRGLEAPNH